MKITLSPLMGILFIACAVIIIGGVGFVGFYLGAKAASVVATETVMDTPAISISSYNPNSREACLDGVRANLNKVFAEAIDTACSTKYVDPLCEARIRGLAQNELTKDAQECIKSTDP